MSEEQQNVVDIGANADMNSQPNRMQQSGGMMHRSREDRMNNVDNFIREAEVQSLEQQNFELVKLLNDEKRKSNDPKSKFERF